MEIRILAFWIAVDLFRRYLLYRPDGTLARVAFTWLGPLPVPGQSWSFFQLRWAIYSFGWLCWFALALSVLFVIAAHYPAAIGSLWFQALQFALSLGTGMAALASIGFLVKAAMARYFNPDSICMPFHVGRRKSDDFPVQPVPALSVEANEPTNARP